MDSALSWPCLAIKLPPVWATVGEPGTKFTLRVLGEREEVGGATAARSVIPGLPLLLALFDGFKSFQGSD